MKSSRVLLTSKIESSTPYSLILEEITDVSNSKTLAVVSQLFYESCMKDDFFLVYFK